MFFNKKTKKNSIPDKSAIIRKQLNEEIDYWEHRGEKIIANKHRQILIDHINAEIAKPNPNTL